MQNDFFQVSVLPKSRTGQQPGRTHATARDSETLFLLLLWRTHIYTNFATNIHGGAFRLYVAPSGTSLTLATTAEYIKDLSLLVIVVGIDSRKFKTWQVSKRVEKM